MLKEEMHIQQLGYCWNF